MSEYNVTSPSEIEAQLRRILASDTFKASPRLSAFLSYIVQKTLTGETDQLKGYTIGVEIYGKATTYDPETDSTVRVEASRLRKALALYYHSAGKNDPVLLGIPKGGYKPEFTYVAAPSRPDTSAKPSEGNSGPVNRTTMPKRKQWLILAGLITLILINVLYHQGLPAPSSSRTMAADAVNAIPTIALSPFYVVDRTSSEPLVEQFNDTLARKLTLFRSIRVITSETLDPDHSWDVRNPADSTAAQPDYVIEGSLRQDTGALKVSVKLLDSHLKTYVWGWDKVFDIPPDGNTDLVDRITTLIVSQIASPYGALENVQRLKLEQDGNSLSRNMRCVLDYQAYSNRKNPTDHLRVRTCLEEAVKRDPAYSDGWAALSWVYGDEVRMTYNLQGSVDEAKQRAFDAAQHAVETGPRSARAHQYMALAAQLTGRNNLVRQHAEIALSLNPYDSEVVADAAWSFCQLGEWERCRQLAYQSMEINPLHPDWYNFALFIYYYQAGQYENSVIYATRYQQDDFLWSDILLAAAYARAGQPAEAKRMADLIEQRFPDFKNNPRDVFGSWGLPEPMIQKILDGVREAGIPLTDKP